MRKVNTVILVLSRRLKRRGGVEKTSGGQGWVSLNLRFPQHVGSHSLTVLDRKEMLRKSGEEHGSQSSRCPDPSGPSSLRSGCTVICREG